MEKLKDISEQLSRIQKYRELLEYTPYLKKFQNTYNMLPETLQKYINKCEVKLLSDVSLDRDDKVFLNTLERLYKQKSNFVG